MNRNWSSKIFAAASFGILFGLYMHHDYVNWNRLGREALLAYDVRRFDLYMAQPLPIIVTVFGATVLAAGVFALYEAIAIGVAAIQNRLRAEHTSLKQ